MMDLKWIQIVVSFFTWKIELSHVEFLNRLDNRIWIDLEFIFFLVHFCI